MRNTMRMMKEGKEGKEGKAGGRKPRVAASPRKRARYLEGVIDVDINDCEFLRQFVTEHGKILPSRLTGATAKQQRQIRHGVRRARNMGLLP